MGQRHPPPLPIALQDIQKIAVLRANGIGDFCFALPALAALRAACPQAEIVLLGKAWHASLLTNRPSPVDRVVVVPPFRGVTVAPDAEEDAAELAKFFAAMRAEHFDLALQLHGGGRYSNPFVQRLGARYTIGLRAADAPPLDRWAPYVYFQNEIHRYLDVVSLLGIQPVTLTPSLAVTAADLAEAQPVIDRLGSPFVVLHPGAGAPDRRWPPERFAAIGDALAQRGFAIAVIGTKPERGIVETVCTTMRAPACNLCDVLSLGGLVGLLSRCALLVSNDSGPLHLGAAVGAASVGIYWCLNMVTAGQPSRLRHRPVIAWRTQCPACGVDHSIGGCSCGQSFVADVPVEAVLEAALDLLVRQGY